MPESLLLWGFIAAALIVLVMPGPGVTYVVARSMTQGYHAGLVSAAGLSAGALVHVAAATAGLSAILLASATAFTIVKVLGAAYLVYLGIQMILARGEGATVEARGRLSLWRLFRDGAIVSVFNPKICRNSSTQPPGRWPCRFSCSD